jgi:ribosomal protein S18 acetylase RimI-like enzyme
MLELQNIKPEPITKGDASWYKPLFAACFCKEDPWLEMLGDDKYEGFHMNRQAFVFISAVDDSTDILTIGVCPEHRKKGLAKSLCEWVLNKAPIGHSFFLEVECTNVVAINLYIKLGFQEISRRRGYYPQPVGYALDAVVMRYKKEF